MYNNEKKRKYNENISFYKREKNNNYRAPTCNAESRDVTGGYDVIGPHESQWAVDLRGSEVGGGSGAGMWVGGKRGRGRGV